MLNTALEDPVKAALQLYVEHYEDDFLIEDLLTTSEWIQLRTIRDFLQHFHEATLFLQGDRTTLDRVLFTVDILKNMIATSLVCRSIPAQSWLILFRIRLRKQRISSYPLDFFVPRANL